jgi:CubicO group peptidase (beta-lactamase class C family)
MPGLGPRSFGHTGAGGRLGIADPNLDIGVGYLCSRMRNIGPTGDPRWHTRLNAIARCVSGTPASKSHT